MTEGVVLSNANPFLSASAGRAVTEPRLGLRLAEVQGGPRVTLLRAPSSAHKGHRTGLYAGVCFVIVQMSKECEM